MPLEFLFVVALILYTSVIWTHRFRKRLEKWMVILFGLALVIDMAATIVVCAFAGPLHAWSFHTITGFASLLIMALHFIWAVSAKVLKGKFEANFSKYSLRAWLLWLAAFISGIPFAG